MYCSKCGDIIEHNEKYCNKCGNFLGNRQVEKKADNKHQIIGIGIAGFLILVIGILIINNSNSGNYYFSDDNYDEEIITSPSSSSNSGETTSKNKYKTMIITDNVYTGVQIAKDADAVALIEKDSTSQKETCPKEIIEIENQIIKKYSVTAVNLCELDLNFAKEIAKLFEKVYNEYPSIRGDLTNLTLVNAPMSQSFIAAFMPSFPFATAKTDSTYPWVIKTQVLLNTTYFLNVPRLEAATKDGSAAGHFPPNASIYSPIAHELAHYMSFLALMRHYNEDSILLVDTNNMDKFYKIYNDFGSGSFSLSMIKEAYEKYKQDTSTTLTLDEWRLTISKYAVAKDNSGEYIYDETIAEAFHDTYVNGNNAKEASKYVVEVLKKKLGAN